MRPASSATDGAAQSTRGLLHLHQHGNGQHACCLNAIQPQVFGLLTANGEKIADLTSLLAGLLGRPVEDQTGIDGELDFSTEWTPDSTSEVPLRQGGEKQVAAADNQTGPAIFRALQESLGLKLETMKVQVKAVMIEHAEKPSAN